MPPLLLGRERQTIGRFEVREFLGRGAVGDVLLAWDDEGGRFVALKVVRLATVDPDALAAEQGGIALQAQLAEVVPQVAAVYEQGEDGELFWVAMEYVAGTDLAEILRAGALPEARAVNIARQLVAMLEVCHEFSAEVNGRRICGIVHGDIKPENIRLQEEDRVRVLDFGIAKQLSQNRRFTVNLFGSLPFTPPERLERGVVDRHSDLWAVGVVLATMVLGHRPFPGESAEELEQALRRRVPALPLPGHCSAGLARIVGTALDYTVERRYASAAELNADLAALQAGRPLPSQALLGGDLHATRRTSRPLESPLESPEEAHAAEATRRTTAVPLMPPAPLTVVPPLPPLSADPPIFALGQAEPAKRSRRSLNQVLIVLAGLFLIFVGAAQLWAYRSAQQIRRELAELHPDLEAIAQHYSDAASWSLLSPSLYGVGPEIQGALASAAERIFDSYHGDDPSTTLRGWQAAFRYLHAAVAIAPRDPKLRARLLYTRGHLDRIEANALRGRGDRPKALATSKTAIGEFEDAVRWDPRWPDPYLGLARIYAYDLFDLAALEKALDDAEKRGYPLGRRETAMRADGWRMQGLTLEARAQKARGSDGEADLLAQAKSAFEQAISFYESIDGYADSANNHREAVRHLDAVEARQGAMREPSGFWETLGRALERELRH